jgi:hypothetical protein
MRSMVEGAILLAQHCWESPSTTPLRVAVPLPVPGRITSASHPYPSISNTPTLDADSLSGAL